MDPNSPLSKRIGGLLASIAGCLLMIYVIGPWLDSLSAIKPLADFIEERDINANAYYYTEVAEFSDAELNMKNTMTYMPK
ncbi:hypothetical protein [Desulfoluna butyratoxydans]|uniref:Uncharacterized protein n=1 Tax=Desulfoluna butyratoxydans TaxID=231438 RepID=A0A4V6IL03_9BACT|nr:hypothetical protein [Desulfoluna butyratoxydans]VFQ43198.1 hypothetical protein MSL71_8260 [Desulfoluna butyratoxydans]